MLIEILLGVQTLLLFQLIRAVRGPEILYHRKKRLTLFWERITEYVTDLIKRLRTSIWKDN